MIEPRPVILILGPTAGGKTHLAIELAKRLPGAGECLSADSMQVYCGMDIGTAKPTTDEQAAAPHHLIDIAEPDGDGFSVDTWLARAEEAIKQIRGRGRWPIIVGGTNLYIQAFLEGLFDGPQPNAELRARLGELEPGELRAKLEATDPEGAVRIHPNDRKRTIRALEVFELTGRPLSEFQSQWSDGKVREDVLVIGLDYAPETINPRINARVRSMMEAGFLEEVRNLDAQGRLGPQACEALGYKQILEHLRDEISLEEAIEQIKIRTRRFAKQQRSWLRRFRIHPRSAWINADDLDAESIVNQSLSSILSLASTGGKPSS